MSVKEKKNQKNRKHPFWHHGPIVFAIALRSEIFFFIEDHPMNIPTKLNFNFQLL